MIWGKKFLEKLFPASRARIICKKISGIRQNNGETLYEYWERFDKLYVSCPHHQISNQLLLQYFHERLLSINWSMINATSGDAFVKKTHMEERDLIFKMTANSQQFGITTNHTFRKVNEVIHSNIET